MEGENDDRATEAAKGATAGPPVAFVLLGASNLARGYTALTHYLESNLAPQPAAFLAAFGPGRGYGAWGGLLNISYPPIVESPLFEKARRKAEKGSRVVALVTDIGNDLLYGLDADGLIAVVQTVFDRLAAVNARVYATTLPVFFEQEVPPMIYYPIRTLLYPKSRVTREQAVDGVRRVNAYLKKIPDDRVQVLPPMDAYLGWDHVHFGLARAGEVWNQVGQTMLAGLGCRPRSGIRFPRMLVSYKEYIYRLVWMDLLKRNRSSNFF